MHSRPPGGEVATELGREVGQAQQGRRGRPPGQGLTGALFLASELERRVDQLARNPQAESDPCAQRRPDGIQESHPLAAKEKTTDDLVPHLPEYDHATEEIAEKCEPPNAAQIDEGASVGDDDHRDSSVAMSFFRSSTE